MDLKVPDGTYTITFDVKEGRVVWVRTTDNAAYLIHQLMLILALVIKDLVGIVIKRQLRTSPFSRLEIYTGDGTNNRDIIAKELLHSRRDYFWGGYDPSVYFLRSATKPGFVKIGQSKYPRTREIQLKGGIFHKIPCPASDPEATEITLHNLFRYLNREKVGEWFRLTDEDVGFVQSLKYVSDVNWYLHYFDPESFSNGKPDFELLAIERLPSHMK